MPSRSQTCSKYYIFTMFKGINPLPISLIKSTIYRINSFLKKIKILLKHGQNDSHHNYIQ